MRFPSAVAVSPDGLHVYVVADVDDSLAVFNRDQSNGRLTFVAAYQDGVEDIFGLDGASGVAVTPNGRYVVVSGYNADSLVVFSRQATSDDLVVVDVEQNGVDGVELFGPTSVTVSPDNKHFYVPSEFDSAVSVFVQDPTRDGIEFAGVVLTDSMPRHVALDASGANAYIAGGDWLRICRRNSETGWLMADWLFVDDLHGADGLEGAAAAIVSPRGHSVFAAGREEHAVAEFWRDPSDGYLELVDIQWDNENGVDGLAYPTSFAMSRDARFLYVAGSGDDAIAIFELPFEEFISGDGFESGDFNGWSTTTGNS
jgi:6-phosphogluconolactonase (cycloisomerase 2 family)